LVYTFLGFAQNPFEKRQTGFLKEFQENPAQVSTNRKEVFQITAEGGESR
jgi:hypothetical protein